MSNANILQINIGSLLCSYVPLVLLEPNHVVVAALLFSYRRLASGGRAQPHLVPPPNLLLRASS